MIFKIYCVTCVLNGKKYYGQTSKTLEKRWKGHLQTVNRKNQCYYLHRAIRKYGEYNFKIELIEEVATKQAANEREMFYINRDNTLEEGYNLTKGGEGSVGRVDSEETKAQRKASFKKTMINGFSEEHRKKMSEARKKHSGPNKGKKFSEEHRENLSLAHVGKYVLNVRKHCGTGVKGVTSLGNGRYKVRVAGKYIGSYSNIEEAARVHDLEFRKKYFK